MILPPADESGIRSFVDLSENLNVVAGIVADRQVENRWIHDTRKVRIVAFNMEIVNIAVLWFDRGFQLYTADHAFKFER